jgi:hypothetical protein
MQIPMFLQNVGIDNITIHKTNINVFIAVGTLNFTPCRYTNPLLNTWLKYLARKTKWRCSSCEKKAAYIIL